MSYSQRLAIFLFLGFLSSNGFGLDCPLADWDTPETDRIGDAAVIPTGDSNPDPILEQTDKSKTLEENLDGLFDNPAADTVTTDTGTDHRTQFETQGGIRFSGNYSVTGKVAAGWTDVPNISNLQNSFEGSLGLLGSSSLSLDARPDPNFGVFGSVSASFNPLGGGASWSGISIGELFCDYTLLNSAFLRIGKFGAGWGQGRLFSPGNLIGDIGGSYAIRVTLPTLLQGVSALVYLPPSFSNNNSPMTILSELNYGGKVDMVFGNIFVGLGTRYQGVRAVDTSLVKTLKGLISMKTVLGGFDLLADSVFTFQGTGFSWEIMSGFFREWNDIKVYAEYDYNSGSPLQNDHRIGAAIGFNNIFGSPVDAGIQWNHAFTDNSGKILSGFAYEPWEHLKIELGIPFLYGAASSVYVANDVDPAKRRLAIAMQVTLSGSY